MATDGAPSALPTNPHPPSLYPSDNLELALPETAKVERPPLVSHVSNPTYQSPLRHHSRTATPPRRPIKETLNARSEYSNSEDDGTAEHRINQYLIKQEIGRGSFGAVHMAVDQFGQEFAVKEFSKSRLRKRAQSNLLRRPNTMRRPGQQTAGRDFNSPLFRRDSPHREVEDNALELIKEEIAIMKKLYHPNVVSLIEVLDDPEEDSLYMVMEMCKNGVVMKVGLGEKADPYPEELCRYWFRDLILGMEYLHAQGIIHRDIKPDNCLITEDNILKLVDFGVSEMFEKDSDMKTKKSAGSPAFMPPELCVAKHGAVSGKAADIWSMGVTLYCMKHGCIPFERTNVLDLFDAIKGDAVNFDGDDDEPFRDLMSRILEKDPTQRITMDELRCHPWVTKGGTDPLLPREENVANIVEPPTQAELNAAITGNMGGLMVVMKATQKFKSLLTRKRPNLIEGILGRASRIVQPPGQIQDPVARPQSAQLDDRRKIETGLTREGVHREITVSKNNDRGAAEFNRVNNLNASATGKHTPGTLRFTEKLKLDHHHEASLSRETSSSSLTPVDDYRKEIGKGQAHDPLQDSLYLSIGSGLSHEQPTTGETFCVSESPGATDFDVYEKAYQEEIEKLMAARNRRPTIFLTRRVEKNDTIRNDERITDHSRGESSNRRPGLASVIQRAMSNTPEGEDGLKKR